MDFDDQIDDVYLLIEAAKGGKHLCMNGRLVNCYSKRCQNDLIMRIEDARHSRDLATTRTDERTFYNGILNILRRKLREVEKELGKKQLSEQFESQRDDLHERRVVNTNDRLLKLSGII